MTRVTRMPRTEQLFKCDEMQSRTQITRLEQSTIVILFPLRVGLESKALAWSKTR
ncbi:hypothetical protein F2Q69_00059958 [Brassica cretica]|uniref:Uncharacterized protein n=2 Tax=Brassica cretica TaxID=69181 RepID=A0A8S9RAS5_BRACR|nr:hypothetical protein DY000_02053873 [Brassica cretica]KAF3569886.1 hypothetical protein F2Q69_00059958 [Brassica cretica]